MRLEANVKSEKVPRKIVIPEAIGDINEFRRIFGITRRKLAKPGFIVEACLWKVPEEDGDDGFIVSGDNTYFHLHQDGEGETDVSLLAFPEQPVERNAFTVTGDKRKILEKVREIDPTLEDAGYFFVQEVLAKTGIPPAEFYDYLKPCLNYHSWKPNQVMVIDNKKMVHGRIPFDETQPESASFLVMNDFYWTPQGTLTRYRE